MDQSALGVGQEPSRFRQTPLWLPVALIVLFVGSERALASSGVFSAWAVTGTWLNGKTEFVPQPDKATWFFALWTLVLVIAAIFLRNTYDIGFRPTAPQGYQRWIFAAGIVVVLLTLALAIREAALTTLNGIGGPGLLFLVFATASQGLLFWGFLWSALPQSWPQGRAWLVTSVAWAAFLLFAHVDQALVNVNVAGLLLVMAVGLFFSTARSVCHGLWFTWCALFVWNFAASNVAAAPASLGLHIWLYVPMISVALLDWYLAKRARKSSPSISVEPSRSASQASAEA